MGKQTEITFNLKGIDDLTKGMANTYRARVGVLGSHAVRNDDGEGGDIDNATLMLIQMFGSISRNIPPRDPLFMPIETHAREIIQAIKESSQVRDAILEKNYKKIYDFLGVEALKYVLMAFETSGFGTWAPNKPSTIAKKGSDRPLIDSSQLRRAQDSDTVKKGDV